MLCFKGQRIHDERITHPLGGDDERHLWTVIVVDSTTSTEHSVIFVLYDRGAASSATIGPTGSYSLLTLRHTVTEDDQLARLDAILLFEQPDVRFHHARKILTRLFTALLKTNLTVVGVASLVVCGN